MRALRRHGWRVARIRLGPDVRQRLTVLGQVMEAVRAAHADLIAIGFTGAE
jgi:hypothetical protein